jgi:glycosidase
LSRKTRGIALTALVAFGGVLFVSTAASAGVAVTPAPASKAATGDYRYPLAGTSTYFVMTDRYANGSTANDTGGLGSSQAVNGFNPADPAFFHGGDFKGLTGDCTGPKGLARIKNLGFNSIWVTPPFGQNTVQGSAAYHGYWINKFDQIDPHWGTQAEFVAFTACAKKIGLKVILDIVANHTGDVIQYTDGYQYIDTSTYKDANGNLFAPADYAKVDSTTFPVLNAASFPHTPFIPTGKENIKSPAWLNDVTNYHNRGNINWSTCAGQCLTWGDFAGLDDLFTEKANVVNGLADVYGKWVQDYPIAGFRIDTERHVDKNFFLRWLPQVQADAAKGGTYNTAGTKNFTAFGEDYTTDIYDLSSQLRDRGMPSVLDFAFQDKALNYAAGRKTGRTMYTLFSNDDLYTTATTNAYSLQTFLGNHDMGRIGCLLMGDGLSGTDLVNRDKFAHALLLLLRGNPSVYYGDEIGMTGGGLDTGCGDQAARQDMFRTQVAGWQSETRIGGPAIGARSGFDATATNPIAKQIIALNKLRAKYPALRTGAQITRLASNGLFAVSRIDAKARTEYVVVFNNGSKATTSVNTSTLSSRFTQVARSDRAVTSKDITTSSKTGVITKLTVPATGWIVLKASKVLPGGTPKVSGLSISADPNSSLYVVQANVVGNDPSTVTFLTQVVGSNTWTRAGIDDAAPYRVYVDPAKFTPGQTVAVQALVRSSSGKIVSSKVYYTTLGQ